VFAVIGPSPGIVAGRVSATGALSVRAAPAAPTSYPQEVPRAGRELAKSSHARRPCALTVIRRGMTQLADRAGAPGRERGGRRWGRLGPWWRTGGQPASPLEASDELVEGAQVVDVKPALLLPPVAEMHDRTGVEEPLLAVDRCAEALDSQHMVVRA